MPTPPYAKVLVSLDGGAAAAGGIAADFGQEVQLSAESTLGWKTQRWEIFAYPPDWPLPAGWTEDGDTGVYYSTALVPDSFALPAGPELWGKWLFGVVVNAEDGQTIEDSTTTGVEIVETVYGVHDVSPHETGQFGGAWMGWSYDLQRSLRIIVENIGGGGGGGPTGAAGGDLTGTYPNPGVGKINGSTVPAGGSLTTGNVLKVSGVGALSYGAVNLAGGANHVTGKLPLASLADGSASGQVLTWNGSAWVAGAVDLADSDATSGSLAGSKVTPNFGSQNVTTTGILTVGTFRFSPSIGNGLAILVGDEMDNLVGLAAGQTVVWNGSSWGAGALDLSDADAVIGRLPFANIAVGTASGQVLTWNGTSWGAGALDLADSDATTGSLAGTKVTPNFGSQNIVTTGDLTASIATFDEVNAGLGAIDDLSSNNILVGALTATTVSLVSALALGEASSILRLGHTATWSGVTLVVPAAGVHRLRHNTVDTLAVARTTNAVALTFDAAVSSLIDKIDDTSSATAAHRDLRGQSSTHVSGVGGNLNLRAGDGATRGDVNIYRGDDSDDLAAVFGAEPTADPTGAFDLYSSSGRPVFRTADGVIWGLRSFAAPAATQYGPTYDFKSGVTARMLAGVGANAGTNTAGTHLDVCLGLGTGTGVDGALRVWSGGGGTRSSGTGAHSYHGSTAPELYVGTFANGFPAIGIGCDPLASGDAETLQVTGTIRATASITSEDTVEAAQYTENGNAVIMVRDLDGADTTSTTMWVAATSAGAVTTAVKWREIDFGGTAIKVLVHA